MISILFWFCVLVFSAEIVRLVMELVVNFLWRDSQKTEVLDPEEVAIVIPCHNSEDVIEATLRTLPQNYRIYCVANNCKDNTAGKVNDLRKTNPKVKLIQAEYTGKSKMKAILIGAIEAKSSGFTHFLQLDDDVVWPQEQTAIEVIDKEAAVTALPVNTSSADTLMQGFQHLEYEAINLLKRFQFLFGKDVTWASGAAAVYRCDTFIDAGRLHDGLFQGDDVQCSYIHHYLGERIDFLPKTIVLTEQPRTLSSWWKQRAHCWEVAFMFLHFELLLRVLFRRSRRGPRWWIRLMTLYRIYDSFAVFAKLSLPFLVFHRPVVLLMFATMTYGLMACRYLAYQKAFVKVNTRWNKSIALAMLLRPLYDYLVWISQLAAFPRAMYLRLKPRPRLGTFVEETISAIQARTHRGRVPMG